MDELAKELASLGDSVAPVWTEARAERLLTGVSQLRKRRRAQRIVATSTLSLALCCLALLQSERVSLALWPSKTRLDPAVPGLREPGVEPRLATAEPKPSPLVERPLQLADGSMVRGLTRAAALVVERNEAKRVGLRLDAGAARFEVVPNTEREFLVRAGAVEVSVLGTVFDVEREPGRVHVSVSRGKVRVSTTGAAERPTLLLPGESGWFDDVEPSVNAPAPSPAHAPASAAPTSERAASRHAARSARHSSRGDAPRVAWRSLSQSGDYEAAYRLLQEENSVEDDPEALLDAADAARLSGHPHAAAQYLRKVLARHRDTPVAPLAAFTLGRVLLERLGQPSEAAEAFSTARQLAPRGSLAQDALAREVEAWSKAGYPDEAYRRAREYQETYPQGRRLRSVQLYGGVRAP